MKDEPGKALLEIRVLKYDGKLHRRWRAHSLRHEGELLVLYAVFEQEVSHSQLGLIRRGTVSIEYYWLNQWYNVFRFLDADASLRNFYCNVSMPPCFEDGVLTYVDLDIDIVVAPSLSYRILDLDEFETNAKLYGYTGEVLAGAHAALAELRTKIEGQEFPFDRIG